MISNIGTKPPNHKVELYLTVNREYMVTEYLTTVTDRKIKKTLTNVQTEGTQPGHRNRPSQAGQATQGGLAMFTLS